MRAFALAIVGFVGTYVMFFVFRWWPTMHEEKANISSGCAKQVELICAIIAAGLPQWRH